MHHQCFIQLFFLFCLMTTASRRVLQCCSRAPREWVIGLLWWRRKRGLPSNCHPLLAFLPTAYLHIKLIRQLVTYKFSWCLASLINWNVTALGNTANAKTCLWCSYIIEIICIHIHINNSFTFLRYNTTIIFSTRFLAKTINGLVSYNYWKKTLCIFIVILLNFPPPKLWKHSQVPEACQNIQRFCITRKDQSPRFVPDSPQHTWLRFFVEKT